MTTNTAHPVGRATHRAHVVGHESPTLRHRRILLDILAVLSLTLMVLLLGGKGIAAGGFGWSDAPLHAMDGVVIHDLLRDRPRAVRDWAEHYFARYPCLGLIAYYPPFHPLIEAIAYAVFGLSAEVARWSVVVMAAIAVVALYWLGIRQSGRWVGFLAAGALATAPFGLPLLRDVMLEWPATAMAILTACAYRAWCENPSWRWAIGGALLACASVLTKQTTVFVLVLVTVHLVSVVAVGAVRGDWPPEVPARKRRSDVQMALMVAVVAAIVLVVLGGYDRFSHEHAKHSQFLVTGRPPWAHLEEVGTYTQYARWFGEIFGWPFLVAWVVGLLVITLRWKWSGSRLPLLWLLLFWAQQTLVYHKESRYFFFALPATALLAARGWTLLPTWKRVPLGAIPLLGLIVWQFAQGVRTPVHRPPDYRPAVQLLVDRKDADLVLVDGVRDGQFVFDVRTNPKAAERIIPLRGSKVLYSRATYTRWAHTTHRGTPEAVLELLNHYGIRYVVVESQLPAIPQESRADWDEPAARVLRQVLADTQRFELIGRYPMACGDPIWKDVELRVYYYRQAPPRQGRTITIPIPALDRQIEMTIPG